jgi:hypothetical protein
MPKTNPLHQPPPRHPGPPSLSMILRIFFSPSLLLPPSLLLLRILALLTAIISLIVLSFTQLHPCKFYSIGQWNIAVINSAPLSLLRIASSTTTSSSSSSAAAPAIHLPSPPLPSLHCGLVNDMFEPGFVADPFVVETPAHLLQVPYQRALHYRTAVSFISPFSPPARPDPPPLAHVLRSHERNVEERRYCCRIDARLKQRRLELPPGSLP